MNHVLMVEDDPRDAELIARALGVVGDVSVEHVPDGAAALRHLGVVARIPDLILLDLHMPSMDGVATLGAIRSHARTRHTPVVMLTSSEAEPDLRRAYEAGVNAYVVKPPGLKELRAAMKDLARFWTRHNHPVPVGD